MARVIVVQPGGGEEVAGGTSARRVKVDIDGLHLTEYTVEAAPMGRARHELRHTPARDRRPRAEGRGTSRELFEQYDMHVLE